MMKMIFLVFITPYTNNITHISHFVVIECFYRILTFSNGMSRVFSTKDSYAVKLCPRTSEINFWDDVSSSEEKSISDIEPVTSSSIFSYQMI